jgi:uncharacterized RDD family membrane protein YckC
VPLDALVLGSVIAAAYFLGGLVLPEGPEVRGPLLLVGLSIVLPIAYFVGFEISPWRATPGKRLMKLEVRDRSGVPMNCYQALCRCLWQPFSVILWPATLIMSLVGRRTVHDWLSRSTVVRRREALHPSRATVDRPALIEALRAARYDPKRDKSRALVRLVKSYCFLRDVTSWLTLAVLISSAYAVYHETGGIGYTVGALLAVLILAGVVIGMVEKAGVKHVRKRIASSLLNPDERASLSGRLNATKRKAESKDHLIDPLLVILK